jgi:hypothetical protein
MGEERQRVFVDRNPQTFSLTLAAAPTDSGVVLDPDNWILESHERVPLDPVAEGPHTVQALALLSAPGALPVELSLTVSGGGEEPVRLSLFDVRGRLVADLFHGLLPEGDHRLSWNGRSSAGERAPSGLYFVRAASLRGGATARIVIAR